MFAFSCFEHLEVAPGSGASGPLGRCGGGASCPDTSFSDAVLALPSQGAQGPMGPSGPAGARGIAVSIGTSLLESSLEKGHQVSDETHAGLDQIHDFLIHRALKAPEVTKEKMESLARGE